MKLDFGHALRDFLSKNQEAREFAAKTLLRESGERGAVDGVIAHHPQLGFRASVMAALAIPPRYAVEAARYLGAWHGVLTQDPDLVAFTTGEGADKLHHLSAPVPPQELAGHLRDAGILRFAIRPGEGTSTAHIYDKGGVYDLTPLAERLNGRVNYSVGAGRRLSEGAGAHAGGTPAAAYRAHIKRAESAAAAPPDAETDRLRLARLRKGFIVGDQRYFLHAAPVDYTQFHQDLQDRGTPNTDELVFANTTGNEGASTGVTGAGNAREVFRHVVDGAVKHVQDNGTHVLEFSAAEPSRKRLYKYLVQGLAPRLPGFKAYHEVNDGSKRHAPEDYFYLVHPDHAGNFEATAQAHGKKLTPLTVRDRPARLERSGPRKAPPLASYGDEIPLYHYGAVSGGVVDPEHFGKNRHTGAEKKHLPEPKRAFFYTHPEEREEAFFGEGTPKHHATYPTKHLYDLVTDPDNVKADWGPAALKALADKGYHGVYYGDYDPIVALWKPVAVTRLARPTAGQLYPWVDAIDAMAEDRVRRGAFADWLEERGFHEDDDTLHTLRHHEGPVTVVRSGTAERGKVRAIAGHPDDVLPVRRLLALYFPQTRAGLHTVARREDVPGSRGTSVGRYHLGWKAADGDHRTSIMGAVRGPDGKIGMYSPDLYDDYDARANQVLVHPDIAATRQHMASRR